MDDLEQIFREADEGGVRLALSSAHVMALRGDAVLFDAVQVPIVAMSVIACLAARRTGEPVYSLGARVGHTLMAAFPAFTRMGRYLQWSIRVRSVTADAVAFLERTALIQIVADEDRRVTLNERGRDFLQKVRASEETAVLLQTLSNAAARTRNDDLRLL